MGSGAPRNGPPPQGTSVLDSFSVVGAGALAEALVRSLTDLGMTCRGVFARRLEKAQMLADSLGVSTSGRVEQAASTASDLLLIVVTDEAVSEVASIIGRQDVVLPVIALHTCGIHDYR
ncbi:MAG: NAD(P)-binding domain-containing protein, partial [Bacteroidetes bacterium]|nr:NAD(P)-binding domain-containing protein [Bacteroidota bacterium]